MSSLLVMELLFLDAKFEAFASMLIRSLRGCWILFGDYDQLFVALNVLAILGVLVFTRIKPWIVFVSSVAVLYLTGVLSLESALHGYTNPSLLVLVLLYLVSLPLEKTQLLRKMTGAITSGSETGSVFRLGLFSAVFSSFVNNTAVVASMLGPLKRQTAIDASKLLLPLSYASIIGGTLTLIGTSTNLIVNGFVIDHGFPALGFFDFTLIGAPVFVCCLAALVFVAPRVLKPRDNSEQATIREYFLERIVLPGSALHGRTVQENGLRQLEQMFLIEVVRDHKVLAPVSPNEVILEHDILVFSGDLLALNVLDDFDGLRSMETFDSQVRENLVEVIVSPSSGLVGRTIKQVDFRAKFDAAVVAVRRGDQRLKGGLGALALRAGDALVLAVGDDFTRRRNITADFIMVGDVGTHKTLSSGKEAGLLTGFVAIIALGASGFVPLLKGLVVFIALLMLFKVITKEDLKARFPFALAVVIASALGLAQAIFQTGLADTISGFAGEYLSGLTPFAALVGVFVLSWLLTEMVTNNAAAAIMFPLAIAVSSQWGADYMPFVMAVAFGASASFLSPFGYQTNLMVYTAGNYRISDYLKLGGPILVVYSVSALTMISIIYGV